jgi:hypothetical protein
MGTIEKFDTFGMPISLRFNGKEIIQTVSGGILSLLLLGVFFIYFQYKAQRLLYREDWILT